MKRATILLLLLVGCADLTPLQRDHQALAATMTQLEANKYALECAPRELAMAQSHRTFAELEFADGGDRWTQTHSDPAKTLKAE